MTLEADSRLFQPSGLNSNFPHENSLPFNAYIQQTQTMLAKARIDLTPDSAAKILQANSPVDWKSTAGKRGVLLIHGLYDSPFTVRDIGQYLFTQGFSVRSVLLPGHGTIPGDLLNVSHPEWIKAVNYGVDSFANEVDELFLLGYSMGGALTIYKALQDTRIRGIILISPALQLKHQWLLVAHMYWCKYTDFILSPNLWYKKRPFQRDYSKYESFPYNAAIEIYQLIKKTRKLLAKKPLNIPLFMAMSCEDDVVSASAALSFFKHQTHKDSRAVLYSRQSIYPDDTRVTVRSSHLLAQKILDFSHIALPISPDNPHYGINADYQDFLRYPGNKLPAGGEIFLGSATDSNTKQHILRRLTYNPYFDEMMQQIGEFLKQSPPLKKGG